MDSRILCMEEEQTETYLKIAGKTIVTNFIDQKGDTKSVRYRVLNVNQCRNVMLLMMKFHLLDLKQGT